MDHYTMDVLGKSHRQALLAEAKICHGPKAPPRDWRSKRLRLLATISELLAAIRLG
jgi:hypothetical protein